MIPNVVSVPTAPSPQISKPAFWTGVACSAIPCLMLLSGSIMAWTQSPTVIEGTTHLGYPVNSLPVIGTLELFCAVLYLIPRTTILGAILLTAYFGGATASHVRIQEPFFPPIVMGILVWGGLWLRDQTIRALIPLRQK